MRQLFAEQRARRREAIAAARARLATQRRLHEQQRTSALLRLAWQQLPAELHALWQQPAMRTAWFEAVLAAAREHMPQGGWRIVHALAMAALQAAVARHGLDGLQVYPANGMAHARVASRLHGLMGVRLQQAELAAQATPAAPAVNASPEAEACRRAFAALMAPATPLAALSGNLERLSFEYRRSVRRARALQDVMLPELDHGIYEIENRLEELEQEDAISKRRGALT